VLPDLADFDLHLSQHLEGRVAAKLAAYNQGIWINRLGGQPDFAFPTRIG
jgi:hypothetical protein